jgi:RND superfamily putative drug exporter
VLSVAAASGVVVLAWQRGYGSHALWGIPATGVITERVPLMMFAFLLALARQWTTTPQPVAVGVGGLL